MRMRGLVKECQGRDDKNGCQEEFAHAGSSANIMVEFWPATWKPICRMGTASNG